MIRHIPNFITCINAFCGCLGVIHAFEHNWDNVLILTGLALLADFLDGFTRSLDIYNKTHFINFEFWIRVLGL